MRILSFLAAGLMACAMSFGIVHAQNTNLGPVATVTSVASGPGVQIIGANPTRKSIRICNVGTGLIWIWPGPLSPPLSAYELPALASGTTTCWESSTTAGGAGIGNSWNAGAASTTGPVSVFEFF